MQVEFVQDNAINVVGAVVANGGGNKQLCELWGIGR